VTNQLSVELINPNPRQTYVGLYPTVNAAGTLSDLHTYARALVPDENGRSPLFKNPETLATMFSLSYEPLYTGNAGIVRGAGRYYHGFFGEVSFGLPLRETPLVGHQGITSHGSAWLLLDVENGIGLVIMTNISNGEQLFHHKMARLVFGE
jgi:hypothetical protein